MSRLLLFIFCITFFVKAKAQSNYDEAILQGDASFKQGQYKKAINKYFAAEAFDPSKKSDVKERVNKTFEKIEALRELAETEKRKAEKALKDKLKADSLTTRAVVAQRQTQKEKEEVDKNFELIKNTNKKLARMLYGLSDNADSATKAILVDVQNILDGTKKLNDIANSRGQYYPVTVDQLKSITGKNTNLLPDIAKWLTKTCPTYGIDDKERYAHFLAQACFETNGFTIFKELGNGAAYEGRESLGNINPGDGEKYKGRGIFMVTGKNNYLQLGILWGERDLFINNPELLEQPEYAVWAACEFWNIKGLNEIADNAEESLPAITKKINGGLNGLENRKKYYDKAIEVLR